MLITARQLSSGRWHIKGRGLANWAQPPFWPCDLETLLSNAFVASTDEFIESALEAASEPSIWNEVNITMFDPTPMLDGD